ncbi:hypothetical protein [Actinoplanes solisilvae]|uniref:hypothetical protein n=1 Tax=Actinoplanes solisilvae TaxID=2486853 RepID=UPI000FD7048C|nr:hypothetical protein [Actinoplanes solisilvae]
MRESIEHARRSGWHLRQTVGHGYGRIFCRRVERGGAVCKVSIFTTPQRPGDRAKDIARAVRDCPHHFADQTADLKYADDLIDSAERLLDAAENFLDAEAASVSAAEIWRKAEDLIDLALMDTEEVERIMAVAREFDLEARSLTRQGWNRGTEAGVTEGAPSSYVAAAEKRTEEASGVVAQAPHQEDPKLVALKVKLIATKGRIADVRLRFGHGRP